MAVKHYKGEIGEFDYNDEMFSLERMVMSGSGNKQDYLHYNTDYKGQIELPKGLINCRYMFYDCSLPYGFSLGDNFDTSDITDMSHMFVDCCMPEGFTLGNAFDTGNVTNMDFMFSCCRLPDGFTLGNDFNTINVKDMNNMFGYCFFPDGFSLGDKFDTSHVENMVSMFYRCHLSEGFTLGENFDTNCVMDMAGMFQEFEIPDGFSLGNKFDTSAVKDMSEMFYGCKFPGDFILGNKFSMGDDTHTNLMFDDCSLPLICRDLDSGKPKEIVSALLYRKEELQEICSKYFKDCRSFTNDRLVFANHVVKVYEQSDNNPIYKNAMNMISSDSDFDVQSLRDEFDAANRCYDKYKDIKLPKRDKSDGREDVGNDGGIMIDDFQESLGE